MSSVEQYRRVPIQGKTIRLIPYAPDFAEQVVMIRNTERERYFLNQAFESTLESQAQWYEGYLSRNNDIYWIIENRKGEFVGTTALYDIDFSRKVGEKGRLNTDEKIASTGPFVLEAELVLLQAAFENLELQTVVTVVREDNVKMQSVNDKLGFVYQKTIDIRGIPYHYYELHRTEYRTEKFDPILEHWRKRDERTEAQRNFR